MVLIRIYIWIFQANAIFQQPERLPVLFLNMAIACFALCVHIVFIVKILLKKKPKTILVFHIINSFIMFFGMIHKTIGFKGALSEIKKMSMSIVLMIIGILVLGYLINEYNKLD